METTKIQIEWDFEDSSLSVFMINFLRAIALCFLVDRDRTVDGSAKDLRVRMVEEICRHEELQSNGS
ncbi:hypothetical protein V6N13_019931 [Hibiscus sabdariffa]